MNVFYEERGTFKVGTILSSNMTSLQVEAPHGKRSKIKTIVLNSDLKNLEKAIKGGSAGTEIIIP